MGVGEHRAGVVGGWALVVLSVVLVVLVLRL